MRKLGLGGLKRDGRVSFGFRIASFDFRTTCETALGVRNGFTDPLGFRMVLDVRNFHRVCKMSSQG